MECVNEDETTWAHQIRYSQLVKVSSLQSRIEAWQMLSQPNMWVQVKSTMDQWSSLLEIIFDLPFGFPINNIISLSSTIHTCTHTHTPRDTHARIHVYTRTRSSNAHELESSLSLRRHAVHSCTDCASICLNAPGICNTKKSHLTPGRVYIAQLIRARDC